MKFDSASLVEQVVWDMRLADLPRDENRTIINRLFNGDPPFDESTAEENNIQINRNDLTGVNLVTQARRQWNSAMLKPGNFFTASYDSGPKRKIREWGHAVTTSANTVLKRCRPYKEQSRGTGANTVLHGLGPAIWKDRRSPVCRVIPIGSLMIPSETEIDMSNCEYLAFFQEWTPAQLYSLTHGPKRDPGWNMDLVMAQLRYVKDQTMKQPNATAFQYMPSRIEELYKQDLGFWGSDAVPTIDVWDFYFREAEDGDGWYRRVFLDWQVEGQITRAMPMPKSRNVADGDTKSSFLYTSGARAWAMHLSEIMALQVGDCSAVAPFRVHSTRGLGWMLWGICELENRLHCKFSEALFEQMMWFFRVASNEQLTRVRKGDFVHFGAVPPNIDWVKANERYTPDYNLLNMGFQRFRTLMSENSAAWTQDFERGASGKEMTATETMARVNAVNALVSGMILLAYDFEEDKDREVMRRLCIKNNPDPMARKFRQLCFQAGVPAEMLDVDRMNISRERVIGGGNKTMEMAQVQFLQSIRKNLNPDSQRVVDHISIESATDDADLAERLAPEQGQTKATQPMLEAALLTDRILRGLPFIPPPDMIPEDFVKVWLADLGVLIQKSVAAGNMASVEQIQGFQALAAETAKLIKIMAQNPEEKARVRKYSQDLSKLMNLIKGFAQRLAQQMKAQAGQNGAGGPDPKDMAKAQVELMRGRQKMQLAAQSHAQKTAQRQVSFEMKEQQQERQAASEMRRLNREHDFKLLTDTLDVLGEARRELSRHDNGEETTTSE